MPNEVAIIISDVIELFNISALFSVETIQKNLKLKKKYCIVKFWLEKYTIDSGIYNYFELFYIED